MGHHGTPLKYTDSFDGARITEEMLREILVKG